MSSKVRRARIPTSKRFASIEECRKQYPFAVVKRNFYRHDGQFGCVFYPDPRGRLIKRIPRSDNQLRVKDELQQLTAAIARSITRDQADKLCSAPQTFKAVFPTIDLQFNFQGVDFTKVKAKEKLKKEKKEEEEEFEFPEDLENMLSNTPPGGASMYEEDALSEMCLV